MMRKLEGEPFLPDSVLHRLAGFKPRINFDKWNIKVHVLHLTPPMKPAIQYKIDSVWRIVFTNLGLQKAADLDMVLLETSFDMEKRKGF